MQKSEVLWPIAKDVVIVETPSSASSIPSSVDWEHERQIRQHPDTQKASSMLLTLKDMIVSTGINDWKMALGAPAVGALVDDSPPFETFGGTSACFCDWCSDAGNIYVTDLRLTFPSELACRSYHEQCLSANAETVIQDGTGATCTRMVELEIRPDSPSSLSLVGSGCHVYCGPTPQARCILSSILVDGKASDNEVLSKRVQKAMHLVYLFRIDRVVCKLCVTSFNGLIPFGYALALAQCCEARINIWHKGLSLSQSGKADNKAVLRQILIQRALLKQNMGGDEGMRTENMLPSTPELPLRRRHNCEQISIGNEAYFQISLFVAALGKGTLLHNSNVGAKCLERLKTLRNKVPKDQVITVDLPNVSGSARRAAAESVELKLRLFVSRSEDAKAVQAYVAAHNRQRPAAFVVLLENLPVAVGYDEALLAGRNEPSPAIADRLRKQAKSRAVRFVRRLLDAAAPRLTARDLSGGRGAHAISGLLAGLLPEHLTRLPTADGGVSSERVLLLIPGEGEDPCRSGHAGGNVQWGEDEEEGVDGLLALCQSPAAPSVQVTAEGAADSADWGGRFLRLGRRRRGLGDKPVEEEDCDGADDLGIKRLCRLAASSAAATPVTCGGAQG